jgi:hypothetical protein
VASRRRTNVADVTGALCLARPATVRRRSRSDDDAPGPNRAKTNDEAQHMPKSESRREAGSRWSQPAYTRVGRSSAQGIARDLGERAVAQKLTGLRDRNHRASAPPRLSAYFEGESSCKARPRAEALA